MAQKVQQSIFHKVTGSLFITTVANETTDVSNKEQLAFVIRHVNKMLDVTEDFLGMYNLLSTTADSIISAISDILLCF